MEQDGPGTSGLAAAWMPAYLAVYLAYLWWGPEGEVAHWASLVLLPWGLLWWQGRRTEPRLGVREVGRRAGLTWPPSGRGMRLAVSLAVVIQVVQLLNRPQRYELVSALSSGRGMWIAPAALLLALATAGFTEEFFFRGIVQRTLSERLHSHTLGIVAASIAFSLYHLPYAFLNPSWPSAGDLPHALRLAMVNGLLGGAVLGVVFVRARSSLLPCILVHAAVDWIPAMRLLAG